MRVWPLWLLLACAGEKVTNPMEGDADTDADADSDADADTDLDRTVLINFAPDCMDTTAIGPGQGESNHVAATILEPTAWPWRVDRVKLALSNEEQSVLTCDAGYAHAVYVWVLEGSDSVPPADTVADRELSFGQMFVEDPVRLLTSDLDPPIVLENGQKLAVGLQFAGTYPDSSCITACSASPESGVDFWSNASAAPYNWSYLEDFGIESNLWIFAEGELVE